MSPAPGVLCFMNASQRLCPLESRQTRGHVNQIDPFGESAELPGTPPRDLKAAAIRHGFGNWVYQVPTLISQRQPMKIKTGSEIKTGPVPLPTGKVLHAVFNMFL